MKYVGVGVDESGDDGVSGELENGGIVGPVSADIGDRPELITGHDHGGIKPVGEGIEDGDVVEDNRTRWPAQSPRFIAVCAAAMAAVCVASGVR